MKPKASTIAFGCLLVLTLGMQSGTATNATVAPLNSTVTPTLAGNGSVITPTPAGNVSNSTIVSNSTALPTDAPTTTASLTRTCALCTSQNVEECTINSTHTGSNVSLVECPAISHCFTSTFADNTSQVTILFRGCSSMPSYGSHCGNVTSSGSLLSYCSCYCDQSNCSTVTNSSDFASQGCRSGALTTTPPAQSTAVANITVLTATIIASAESGTTAAAHVATTPVAGTQAPAAPSTDSAVAPSTDSAVAPAKKPINCSSCSSEHLEDCLVNSTYVGSEVEDALCPAEHSCYTFTLINGTVTAGMVRSCGPLSNGSNCGPFKWRDGKSYTGCYCYCNQKHCSTVTNAEDIEKKKCLTSSGTTPAAPTKKESSQQPGRGSGTEPTWTAPSATSIAVGLSITAVLATHPLS